MLWNELTEGEKILVLRRRSGKTQAEAARDTFGVSLNEYREIELSTLPETSIIECPDGFPLHEQCFITRRRMGWTQKELARLMGMSVLWIQRMENGKAPIKKLAEYWETR